MADTLDTWTIADNTNVHNPMCLTMHNRIIWYLFVLSVFLCNIPT